MKVVAILRAVQDPAGVTVNRRAQKIFVNRAAHQLNPADHNALEAALALAGAEASVTALSYGGPPAEQVLRDALAAGASRAVWVQAPSLAFPDAAVLARALHRAIVHVGGADVVAMGAEVLDADLAQIAPRLAVMLSAVYLPDVFHLSLPRADVCEAVVGTPAGLRRVEVEGPVVAAIARDCNRPRYPPAAALVRIYSTPTAVEAISLDALGFTPGDLQPLSQLRGESFPPERDLGRILEGGFSDTASHVADLLRSHIRTVDGS